MDLLQARAHGALQAVVEARAVERGDPLPAPARRYAGQLTLVVRWSREFLCRPHSALGRTGQVCPYAQPTLDGDTFWLTILGFSPPHATGLQPQ